MAFPLESLRFDWVPPLGAEVAGAVCKPVAPLEAGPCCDPPSSVCRSAFRAPALPFHVMEVVVKSLRFALPLVAMLGIFLNCTQHDAPLDPSPLTQETAGIGAIHNEFLEHLLTRLGTEKTRARGALSAAAQQSAILDVVNEMTDAYGAARLPTEEILAAVARGKFMAQQDPVDLVNAHLDQTEQLWWHRFASEATPESVVDVYRRHVERYGAPIPGSMLANVVDVAVHSAQFWARQHATDEPLSPHDLALSGWKRRAIRFVTVVATDGVAGGLAAAGGGGPLGGGIVGGLASYGADCLLFGCE